MSPDSYEYQLRQERAADYLARKEPVLSTRHTVLGALAFLAFLLCIPLVNWMIANVGVQFEDGGPHLIPVGFGLYAPSGVLVVGIMLVLRDYVHERWGLIGALGAVVLGALLSLGVGPWQIALASATAFFLSEMADTLVYAPLRRTHRPMAVFVSQIVGAIVDSYIFVRLAFGSFDYAFGQALGKIYMGVIAAILLWVILKYRHQRMAAPA